MTLKRRLPAAHGSLGQRIRKRRRALELAQRELAEALGLTPQHISAIEQDKRTPSLPSLARLAEELGVTVDYLLTGKESVVTDTISAIKADKTLKLRAKRALIMLVQALREGTKTKES